MPPKPIAIRASRLFDGERFHPGPATLLMDGGRILGIEDGFPEVGVNWQVVDGQDCTVLPGLIDTHAHLVCDSAFGALDRVAGYSDAELDAVISEGLRRQLAGGVTTVRDLGDRRFSVVDRRDRQRSGLAPVPEPTILAAGPPVTSRGGHCFYLGGEVQGTPEITAAVAERARRQVDVVKVMASGGMNTAGTDVMRTQFSVAEMTLLVDRAHAAGLPVTAHAHGLPAVMQAIDVGADGIEHCSCLTDKGVELSLELADRLAASKVVIGGFIPVPPITDLSQAPPGIREMMQKTGLTPERLTQMRLTWLGRLIGSGVRLTTGPDSGINAYVQHGHLHKAVKFLVDAGASHQQALAGATSVAAQACSVDDRKGLLRAGYDSDVLVVNGDLQEDVGALAAVRTVILGGSIVSGARPTLSAVPTTTPTFVPVPQIATQLGIVVTKVHQLIREHQLLAVRVQGVLRVPGEFIQDGMVVKGLPATITLLRDAGYDDQEMINWLYTAEDSLPGSPIDALRENRGREVHRRAQVAGF